MTPGLVGVADPLTVGGGARSASRTRCSAWAEEVHHQELESRTSRQAHRSCGNCSKQYARTVVVDNVKVATAPGKSLVGINSNLGDQGHVHSVQIYNDSTEEVRSARYKRSVTSASRSRSGNQPRPRPRLLSVVDALHQAEAAYTCWPPRAMTTSSTRERDGSSSPPCAARASGAVDLRGCVAPATATLVGLQALAQLAGQGRATRTASPRPAQPSADRRRRETLQTRRAPPRHGGSARSGARRRRPRARTRRGSRRTSAARPRLGGPRSRSTPWPPGGSSTPISRRTARTPSARAGFRPPGCGRQGVVVRHRTTVRDRGRALRVAPALGRSAGSVSVVSANGRR